MVKDKQSLSRINGLMKDTLMETLRMECIGVGDSWIELRMPVDKRSHQPMGVLHGGASAALMESAASMGSEMLLDLSKEVPLGLEINANHVGSARDGFVTARAEIIHQGNKTHVWNVEIRQEDSKKLVCVGRVTLIVLPRK